jgi:hypothetical protein
MSKSKSETKGQKNNGKDGVLVFLRNNVKGFLGIFGIILILVATILPAISFNYSETAWTESPRELMWNGDQIDPESDTTVVSYDEAKAAETWDPFLTDPLTPDLILYLAAIIVILGILLRAFGIRTNRPGYEKGARHTLQLAFVLLWVAIGVLFLFFLNIQTSSRGIDFPKSLGAILAALGSISLVPLTSPYDSEASGDQKK